MRIKTSGVTIDKKLFFFASQELRYGLVDKCELNCATAVPYKILPEKFSMSRVLIAFRALGGCPLRVVQSRWDVLSNFDRWRERQADCQFDHSP